MPGGWGQFRSARIQIEQQNVLSFKARFECLQVTKASDEQAGRGDDEHTERDLRNDERVPSPIVVRGRQTGPKP